jgi:hypothetical protein
MYDTQHHLKLNDGHHPILIFLALMKLMLPAVMCTIILLGIVVLATLEYYILYTIAILYYACTKKPKSYNTKACVIKQ